MASALHSSVVHASEPWTEEAVVVRALSRAPLVAALDAEIRAEVGRGRAAAAYPNPELSYVREQTFGTAGTGEDYLSLAQTIDLGNRRGRLGEAGVARAAAVRAEGEGARLDVASDARLRFYEVLARRARVAALEAWIARLDEALAIVRRREERGDAAEYDRRRLERERAAGGGRLEAERAGLERAMARLGALLGEVGAEVEVKGPLLPAAEPPALPELEAQALARPELRALGHRADAAALDQSAAARGWIPDLRLELGWKGADLGAAGRTDGFVVGAALALPLWDRAAGLAEAAEGEAEVARGRRALLEAELRGELAGARAESVRLHRAALEFRRTANAASTDLARIATAGYAGGELGLLELLDAYRGLADDALAALDLEHAARRARIELDRRTGVTLP